jgi:hypothetical protein
MHICSEANNPKRQRTNRGHRRYIKRFEDRIYTYPISVVKPVGKIYGAAVHQDQVDLGVWDTQPLYQIFDGVARGA